MKMYPENIIWSCSEIKPTYMIPKGTKIRHYRMWGRGRHTGFMTDSHDVEIVLEEDTSVWDCLILLEDKGQEWLDKHDAVMRQYYFESISVEESGKHLYQTSAVEEGQTLDFFFGT